MEFLRMCFGAVDVDQMEFSVVKKEDTFEIRQYQPCVVVETTITDGDDGAFRRLARYIGVYGTPENTIDVDENKNKQIYQKIAMTAPVLNEKKIAMAAPVFNGKKIAMTAPVISNVSSETTMAFVLPKEYRTIESAPKPLNEKVRLREVPERKCAVTQFTWNVTEKQAEEKANSFIEELNSKGYKTGAWQLARYNPPWTISFLRCNEILVNLA